MTEEKPREELLFELPWPKFRLKLKGMNRRELYCLLAHAHGWIHGVNEALERLRR